MIFSGIIFVVTFQTQSLAPPGNSWQQEQGDVAPNKPRLMLAPIDETEVALAAFFNEMRARSEEDLGHIVRKVYRPGVPVTTFASAEELYPTEDELVAYRNVQFAAQDFDMMRGDDVVKLREPHLQAMKYDQVTVLAAHFGEPRQAWRFGQIREKYTGDAEAAIRVQQQEQALVPIARRHTPNIVLPIARVYRGEQATDLTEQVKQSFARHFPGSLQFRPYLATPTVEAASASFPETTNEDKKRRQEDREKLHRELYEDYLKQPEDASIGERAVRAAQQWPQAEVVFTGAISDVVAQALLQLPNLNYRSAPVDQAFMRMRFSA